MQSRNPARLARSTGAAGGFLVIVLGLWGALAPFIGPYFGYAFGSHATWHYTGNRFWLDILPGAVAVLAGAMLAFAATRRSGLVAGWLGIAAGAWFVVGPAVSMTWAHGGAPIGAPLGGDVRRTIELVGSFYGLGAVIVALVAFAGGRFASRPEIAETADPPAQEGMATRLYQPAPTTEPAATTTAAAPPPRAAAHPRTRRASLRRRSGARAPADQ